jgi:hypothetical protein
MQKHRSRLVILVTCVVAHVLVRDPRIARASPPFDLMGDVGSSGGLQARTVAGGSGAAYFNPALLTEAPAGVTLGFMVLNQRIGIELDGRPGTEFAIPEGLENAGHADASRFDNYAVPTNWLQFGRMKTSRNEAFVARPRQAAGSGHETKTYEVFGLIVKFFDDHLALGMHAMIPNGEFTKLRAFFNDEREQYFSNSLQPELYADRMTALSVALGLGVKLTDRLSLGAGTTFALAASVVAPTYVVDTGNLGKILIDMNAGVNIGISPHFGLTYRIGDRLHLSASVHTPQRVELGTAFTFLLGNGIEQSSGVTFVLDYTPWQVGAGATYDLVQTQATTFTLAATAMYASWSDYEDRHGTKPTPSYAWSDTVSPSFGLRLRLQRVTTLLDATYVPTPVPLQTGRTNYVDNDRIAGTLGAEYEFPVMKTNLKLGLQLQLHRLLPRYQRKLPTPTRPDGTIVNPELVKDELPDDAQLSGNPIAAAQGLQTNNPGWPGFASGGFILGGSIYLTLAL